MGGMPKTVMVSQRLPEELVRWLDATAKSQGVSRSRIIERTLEAARSGDPKAGTGGASGTPLPKIGKWKGR